MAQSIILPEGLVLRPVRTEADIERYAALHATVVSAAEGITCRHLMRYHPAGSYDDYWLVEESRTGEVVSTICLIPWRCRYEEVSLKVAMLEMVVTDPRYRHLGLVRAQIGRFHELVTERNYDLSIIEGIPYYYRQYGYAYAGDHWRYDALPVWRIPEPLPAADHYDFRPATVADIPRLVELYDQSMAAVQVATLRDADYWRFLLTHEQYPVEMMVDQHQGQVVGYLCTLPQSDRQRSRVIESGLANSEMAMAVLQRLKATTTAEVQLGWPESNPLVRLARTLGSTPAPADQWLIRLPDVAQFLNQIAPVLERRLATAGYAGATVELCINLFRQAYRLHFVAGKLQPVAAIGFVDASMGADGGDLCIPPDAFVRLLFGYRSLTELSDAWPDLVVKPASRHLLEILFPKLNFYFWLPYFYYGS